MANSSGIQDANHASSSFNGANPSNGNLGLESTATALMHNPGISMDWSAEEQAMLEAGLSECTGDSNTVRYAKIALQLPDKTVRDVALRCRWMTKKENSKRRKDENLARKSKDKKERVTDPLARASPSMAQGNVPPYGAPVIPADYDDGFLYKAIGGVTGELFEQNAQAFNQISANLSSLRIQENVNLLCQARDNILKIMNDLNDVPEVMKQMPPLPVSLNEKLADTILPPPNFP